MGTPYIVSDNIVSEEPDSAEKKVAEVRKINTLFDNLYRKVERLEARVKALEEGL